MDSVLLQCEGDQPRYRNRCVGASARRTLSGSSGGEVRAQMWWQQCTMLSGEYVGQGKDRDAVLEGVGLQRGAGTES